MSCYNDFNLIFTFAFIYFKFVFGWWCTTGRDCRRSKSRVSRTISAPVRIRLKLSVPTAREFIHDPLRRPEPITEESWRLRMATLAEHGVPPSTFGSPIRPSVLGRIDAKGRDQRLTRKRVPRSARHPEFYTSTDAEVSHFVALANSL